MKRTFALLALLWAGGPMTALAQTSANTPPTTVTIRPASEPNPALKYRLTPERLTLVPGNAAVLYHRAILMMNEKRNYLARLDSREKEAGPRVESAFEKISRWSNEPIAEIPRDQARTSLEFFRGALNEVELATIRSTCDWEYDRRTDGIFLSIEEVQQLRSLARMIAVHARLAILDGKLDEAFHWIETGLVMGRHASQGPIAVQALVGIAVDSLMLRCLEDLLQAPGSPNFYWALADRPRPFIDMRYAMEGERHILDRELPGLAELERGPWGLDQARKFASDLQYKLHVILSDFPSSEIDAGPPKDFAALSRRFGIAAMTAKIYPEARRALIAQGRPEAEVDSMPIVQVAALFTNQQFQRRCDDAFKWMNLPYWQSYDKADSFSSQTVEQKLANPLLTMFLGAMPALHSVRLASVRLDRQLDALQCIEAIRLYAFAHQGKLPPSLEAITEAPVPLDVATGKPFAYKLDGESATLSAPLFPGAPDHHVYLIRYALKLAK
jgi:hypothetical protein